MSSNDALNKTITKLIPPVQTEFLPEKDIPHDAAIREDYEKLRINYELQRDIGSEIEIDVVLNRILDRTFEFLKYDGGVILLVTDKGTLRPQASRNITNGKKHILSTTLVKHVVKERKGIISTNILIDDRFNVADSIISSGLLSTIAVPILHQDEILGVIVIESSKRVGAFTEKDLHLMMSIANHTAQFIKNSIFHEELRISFNSAIRTLSATVDAKHTLTAGHSERVAKFSELIAKQLGVKGNRLEALCYAALLHDIGKIGIPDRILLKNGPFDDFDREEMNKHPTETKNILDNFHFPKKLRTVPDISALHHERIDGQGYPKGLTGSDLPLEAKIISVADVFDALTSPRDYPKYDETGKAMNCNKIPVSEAVAIIEKEVGTHFEAEVVIAFKKCLPLALFHFRKSHFEPEYVDYYIKSHAPNLTSKLI
jgi:HD-GYP domain-containing protein (c-di-GMP phosphodiesterase class II)